MFSNTITVTPYILCLSIILKSMIGTDNGTLDRQLTDDNYDQRRNLKHHIIQMCKDEATCSANSAVVPPVTYC
uniref:Secreted protein n=1 Tax=Heterorhabditis bacteriophora TaxID=37862 RepID=A0A1I7WIR0_HETBA